MKVEVGKNQQVVPQNGRWAVRGSGNQRAMSVTDTQREALKVAREIARRKASNVVLHGRVGRIRDKDSYGNDPFPPRDIIR